MLEMLIKLMLTFFFICGIPNTPILEAAYSDEAKEKFESLIVLQFKHPFVCLGQLVRLTIKSGCLSPSPPKE